MQIDIEGSEYNLISSLHELDAHLPRQLAIEFHLQDVDFQMLPVKDDIGLAGFLLHLANLGWVTTRCSHVPSWLPQLCCTLLSAFHGCYE